jgi:hypothetical protein
MQKHREYYMKWLLMLEEERLFSLAMSEQLKVKEQLSSSQSSSSSLSAAAPRSLLPSSTSIQHNTISQTRISTAFQEITKLSRLIRKSPLTVIQGNILIKDNSMVV